MSQLLLDLKVDQLGHSIESVIRRVQKRESVLGPKLSKKLHGDSHLDLNTLRVYEIQSLSAKLLFLG